MLEPAFSLMVKLAVVLPLLLIMFGYASTGDMKLTETAHGIRSPFAAGQRADLCHPLLSLYDCMAGRADPQHDAIRPCIRCREMVLHRVRRGSEGGRSRLLRRAGSHVQPVPIPPRVGDLRVASEA